MHFVNYSDGSVAPESYQQETVIFIIYINMLFNYGCMNFIVMLSDIKKAANHGGFSRPKSLIRIFVA